MIAWSSFRAESDGVAVRCYVGTPCDECAHENGEPLPLEQARRYRVWILCTDHHLRRWPVDLF